MFCNNEHRLKDFHQNKRRIGSNTNLMMIVFFFYSCPGGQCVSQGVTRPIKLQLPYYALSSSSALQGVSSALPLVGSLLSEGPDFMQACLQQTATTSQQQRRESLPRDQPSLVSGYDTKSGKLMKPQEPTSRVSVECRTLWGDNRTLKPTAAYWNNKQKTKLCNVTWV